MRSSARPIGAVVLLVAAVIAFWMLALSPKREEADRLSAQVETLKTEIAAERSEVTTAAAAHRAFPAAYRQLVELGQAVPSNAETPSLLIELGHLAATSGVTFESLKLEGGGEEEAAVEPAVTEAATGSVTATELEASLLPLGASVGLAGLAVMPYTLQFKGTYFQIATFVGKLDALVKSGKKVAVDGRLITINGFSLAPANEVNEGGSAGASVQSPQLTATFSVNTYLTPPGEVAATPGSPTQEVSTSSTGTETSSGTLAAR